jgi:uncharacterized protein YggE
MGQDKQKTMGTLELSGEGRVTVKPDIATIRLSIVTEEKTADEAVLKNARRANEVIERLVRLEIPRDALATTGLSLYPVYQTDPGTNVTHLVGYRAQDSLSVETRVQLAGKVFDTGIAAGATESSGITFSLGDERPHREKALALAIKAARSEADLVCRAMEVKLCGARTIQVLQGGGPIQMRAERMMKTDTPVLPGDLTISASVRVVFEYHA